MTKQTAVVREVIELPRVDVYVRTTAGRELQNAVILCGDGLDQLRVDRLFAEARDAVR